MGNKTTVAEDKKAISQVIYNSIGWAMNKDIDLLYSSMAHDSDFFIYHPDNASTIRGFDSFKNLAESFFMHDDFKATGYDIRDLHITLSHSGDVDLFTAVLDDFGEWQGRPSVWKNVRWTGVLEKRDGNWVIAQMHFSFASDATTENKATDDTTSK
jgi:ketosteroid isomerase-like protein